jgi:cytoskeletal protein CcmA (bactofilin family)
MGQCRSETIEIDKNGNVTGTLAYRTLAIKKGGVFPARQSAAGGRKSNVVGFIADTAIETKDKVEAQ